MRRVREEGAEDFEDLIRDIAAGLKIDSRKLRDGWKLVQGTADASSLMRAKGLLLDRALRTFGVEESQGNQPVKADVSLFFFERATRRVGFENETPSEPTE